MKFEVNTGTLRSDTASIRAEINALKQEAQTLRHLSARLNRMWEGEAKAEFLKNCALELNALDASIASLEGFTNQTRSARTEYEHCERFVAGVVDALRI
jgi:WXG100 family type VII secretion target